MRHTPGPWKAIDDGEDYIVITDVGQNFGICRLEEISNESRKAMTSNARLIAAAPEMLELVHHLISFTVNAVSPDDFFEIREKCYRVLDKVRGES